MNVDASRILQFFVQLPAGTGCQIAHSRQEIWIIVTQLFQRGIVSGCYGIFLLLRYQIQQIVCEFAAPVGCVDGGEGRHIRSHPKPGNGVAAVQTTLGMGDDVHLLTASLLKYGLNPGRNLRSRIGHRGR